MKKRWLAAFLALCMALTMLPTAFAADAPAMVTGRSETLTADTSTAALPDHETLLAGYVQGLLYPEERGIALLDSVGGTVLTGLDRAIYTQLKAEIQRVAAQGGSTVFSLPLKDLGIPMTWTKEDLGVTGDLAVSGLFTDETSDALLRVVFRFDLNKVIDALLADCPYELYWYDKVTGVEGYVLQSASLSQNGNALTFDEDAKMVFSFSVAYGYRSYALPYRVDAAQAQAAAAAVENANAIVEQYSTCSSDYEKLLAYKEEICALTDYNTAAAENSAVPYGDPWQLVYVFDGREDTTVVCEGYAKAFQYLCDRTVWEDAACYTVSGTLSSAASEGPHMWNVVSLGADNYLVDVTNSDTGSAGADGSLFLAGAAGSPAEGYTLEVNGNAIRYTYDENTKNLFGTGLLTLAGTSYDPELAAPAWQNPYTDVARTDWYYGAVRYAHEAGLMAGTGAHQFSPNGTTTRGMLVTILYRQEGAPDLGSEAALSFADVAAGAYYALPVRWAKIHGVVNGVSATQFAPEAPVTREQLAAILYRYAQHKGYDTGTGSAALGGYTDAGQISPYALPAMGWANRTGLITGRTATTLDPQGQATRAEAATILMRFGEAFAQ